VFVNAEADTINGIVERTGLTCVQLHGDEGPEEIERIAAPCIKAFRVKDESSLVHARQWVQALPSRRNFAGVLLDAYSRQVRGGSGEQFNWSLVADARAAGLLGELEPFILAGGLTPENVNLAIEVVKPWAVDVASGVEKAPGVKDLKKVSRLIRNTLDGDQIKSDFWI
jgi:phosphoribosylanthranilate isomerase